MKLSSSTAITALVRDSGQVPRTFAVGFREAAFDESPYARLVAHRFKTDHVEILLGAAEVQEQIPQALAAMDQPTVDGINVFAVSSAAAKAGIRVLLSGLGGDEG